MTTSVDAAYTRKHLTQGAAVINVLPEDQYRDKHIPGSINVPFEAPDFERRIRDAVPDKGRAIIVHCSSLTCQTSTKAARRMEELGYTNVQDFKAGLQGWDEAKNDFESGLPVPAASEQAPTPEQTREGTLERPPRPGRDQASHQDERRSEEVPKL